MYSYQSLSVLRSILHNLKKLNSKNKLENNPSIQFLFNEYRKHEVTDERTCRAKNELLFQAQIYSTYLESINQYQRLLSIYNKGEVSIEDAAKKVGLKLPKKYE